MKNDLPWIIVGDFNLIRSLEDTTARSANVGNILDFNYFIHESCLTEVPLQGRSFTWSNKRPSPTFSRLERTMLSYHWNDMSVSAQLTDLPATASDHVPLLLHIKPHENPPKRLFRFETSWLKYDEISEVVARAWLATNNNNPIKRFRQKIVCVQKELKAWAQAKFEKWDTYLERSKWVV